MANAEHLAILQQGTHAWNTWRSEHPDIVPDLSWARIELHDLRRVNLARAHLRGTIFQPETDLRNAILWKADLAEAELLRVDLREANLRKAILFDARLVGANLRDANLTGALLVDTSLEGADLSGAFVYGCSVWDINAERAIQRDLVINNQHSSSNEWTPSKLSESKITVDDLQLAQFVSLLRSNTKVGSIIDTITSKVVLILGRFSAERKPVLDAIRDALRIRDLIPIIFDFAIPANRDVTETVKVLAGLAKFVVADVTDATEVRAELHSIVPDFPNLPIQPVVLAGRDQFVSLLGNLSQFPWVLPTFEYQDLRHLLANLDEAVIQPAVAKQRELAGK
jgi:Pentapeptide repeats (8 copies)